MRNLVTGATGFVGSHLCRALLSAGENVRILVRSDCDATVLAAKGAKIHRGDITEPTSLIRATTGIDCIFHCAARVSDWGTWADFRHTNVLGVKNMLAAARKMRVRRFVHFSTTDVYGFPRHPGAEELPLVYRGWPYGDTKIDGEKEVWAFHRDHGLPVTVMRPANVYGVGSRSFVLKIAQLLKSGDMVHLGAGRKPAGLCSVQNLVDCTLRARSCPAGEGQAYNVTDGSDISWREFVNVLARKLSLPGPRITLPRRLAYLAGWLAERHKDPARQNGRPLLTRMAVEIFTANQAFSIEKAERELGYQPRALSDQAWREMTAWLAAEGF